MFMTSRVSNQTNWSYHSQHRDLNLTFDPRVAIARHIDWAQTGSKQTSWSIPEPENYNFCLVAKKPIENNLARAACWYLHDKTHLWISCYYAPAVASIDLVRWVYKQDYMAYWQPVRRLSYKSRERLLDQGVRKNNKEVPLNHLLLFQNVYDSLKYKCDDYDTIVEEYIGHPSYKPEDWQQVEDVVTDIFKQV